MVQYQVKDPQGQLHVIDGPEGASPDEIIKQAQSLIPSNKSSYWGDVAANAGKEIPAMADGISKMASMLSPIEMTRSGIQMARGTPFSQTPTGEDVKQTRDVIRSAPESLLGVGKTIGKTVAAPFEYILGGKQPSETMLGQQFRERPVGTAMDIASVAIPAMKAFRGGPLLGELEASRGLSGPSGGPNLLERAGIRGMNQTAGLKPSTIEDMTPRGQNPGKYGVQLGQDMAEEGASGLSATSSFDNASKLADQYGESVESALKKIKAQNRSLGVYPELEDSLKRDANKILKPLLDEANKFNKSQYPLERFQGKYQRAAYESLAEKANANGGFIEFDDIRSEMQRIGKMMESAGEENYKVLSKIYGKLANTRNMMIEDVATEAMNPELKENLLKANSGYSKYMRLLPDMKRAAAREAVGTPSLSLHQALIKHVEPLLSKGLYKTGKFFRRKS